WHPDGTTLAAACDDLRIYLWDLPTRKAIAALAGHTSAGMRVVYSPAGDLLASTGWEGTLRLWDPRTAAQLFSMPNGMPDLRFSPDGRRLAANRRGQSLGIVEVAVNREEYRTLASGLGQVRMAYHDGAIHPNGRLLAVAMDDGVRLWDLPSGRELAN